MSAGIDELIGVEVERSFGGEPPLRDPREYVARGRRARRRRTGGAVGTVVAGAVVAAVAIGGIQPLATSDREVEPAGPTTTAVKVATPVPVDPETAAKCETDSLGPCGRRGIGWDDIHLDGSGKVVRGYADVEVTGYYDNVLGDAYGVSAALEVSADGETVWMLLTATKDFGESGFQSDVPDPDRTFDEWVRDSLSLGGGWFGYTHDPMIPSRTSS
ncbi:MULTISPECIES: hypothetical protein [unclassified Nocardioides]|uniref:hypothetical protein n=1 Tax=unclassified Nocardioides TaxID=2615069 RepID=UPI00360B1450